ncbi:MAG: hypothetical protein MN733_11235 [Nitrososphaera sp.]|nr:hypothetical protein [Nitrososphaera sp.]
MPQDGGRKIRGVEPLKEEAAITLSLAGLGLICTKNGVCEVGFVPCDEHKPMIDICEITLKDGKPLKSKHIDRILDLEGDILIDVVKPSNPGIQTHEHEKVGFDRGNNKGDDRDFRWVVNLERDVHGGKLDVNWPNMSLFITHGHLYTEQKTDEEFWLVSEQEPPRFLGRIATRIGVDISLESDGYVDIRSSQGTLMRLLKKSCDSRYLITIENLCEPSIEENKRKALATGSDFQYIYKGGFVRDPIYCREFDLRHAVRKNNLGDPQQDFALDNPPQVCCITGVCR